MIETPMIETDARHTTVQSTVRTGDRMFTADEAASRSRSAADGGELFQDAAKRWIRRHENAALLAAFAVGVFIGAWMRG